jgi:hypothetical protein
MGMPSLRTYSVFICHDWEYSGEYNRIREFLDGAPNFDWEDRSVPDHDPLANDETLQAELQNQIRPADVMLVLAGMYTSRSEWMAWEMAFGRRIGKPIIGIAPRGSQRLPQVVQRNAIEIVGWNSSSIVQAIRRYAPR